MSGAALALAFPEPDLAPAAWVSIAGLLIASAGTGARTGAVAGGAFGIAFFGTLLAWVTLVGYVAWALLVVLQASWLAAFGALWGSMSRRIGPTARIVAAASLWVVIEYGRTRFPLGGFPWGQIAQSQGGTHVLDAAAVGGSWLVAWIVVAANAALGEAVTARSLRSAGVLAAAAAIVLAAPAAAPGPAAERRSVRVAIVQGNVPRGFAGSVEDKQRAILASHASLTRDLAGAADLVVWPESAVGLDLTRRPDVFETVSDAARAAGSPMIVGGNLDLPRNRYKVMTFLFSDRGRLVDRYQKIHLVPFGEYVPARRWLDWIALLEQVPSDATAGSDPVVFTVDGVAVGSVISFEGDFGSLVRERVARGARMVVVSTNTSTWGESWASAQHLAFSRVRAVENGVPVVHAALSGTSAFVTAAGSVELRTPLWEPAVVVSDVSVPDGVSLYARTGDWVPVVSLVAGAAAALPPRRRKRRK